MKKKKTRLVVGTAMLIGCIMSPMIIISALANKPLYIDKTDISLTLIFSALVLMVIIGVVFLKDGIKNGENAVMGLFALIPFIVGLISSIASPWYFLVSLFGVVFIVFNLKHNSDETRRSN